MVLATVVASVVVHFLLRHAQNITRLTTSPWDDALIQAAKRPLAIWLIGLALLAGIVGKESGAALFEVVPHVRNVGVILCLAWFLIRLVRHVAHNVMVMHEKKGEEVDRTTVDALSKLARFVVFISASLVAMQTLGFSVSGVLAAGGIGGLALGFAAKDLLANFFGGLTIYLDRPFNAFRGRGS